MSRGIKRRCSVSKYGELEETRGSQGAGRLRKRSRNEKTSNVLRGGAYTSKFGWPYNPMLPDEEIVKLLKRMDGPIRALFSTRLGSYRGGFLTPTESYEVDTMIEAKMRRLDKLSNNHDKYNMMAELQSLLSFINLIVVTNITPDTIVKLNVSEKPFVDTTLEFNHSVVLRVEDVYSNKPIVVHDWRYGCRGMRRDHVRRRIDVSVESFEIETDRESLIVRHRSSNIQFRVWWFGPHEFYENPKRKMMIVWRDMIKFLPNTSESLISPRLFSLDVLLKAWLQYIEQLAETKKFGVHKTLPKESYDEMHAAISDRLLSYNNIVKGRRYRPVNFAMEFFLFMRSIRVVNMTPGSVVLVRNHLATHMFQHLVAAEVALHLAEILAAEVHLLQTKEIVPITKNMVTVNVVEDCLEAVINIREGCQVVLRISWLGPYRTTPDGVDWGEFMGHPKSTLGLDSDDERAIEFNFPIELGNEAGGKAVAKRSWSTLVEGAKRDLEM